VSSPRPVDLERVDGWVVVRSHGGRNSRGGDCVQRERGNVVVPTAGGFREGGWLGSRPPRTLPIAGAVRSCGNPGGWRSRPGFPTVVGRSGAGGWWAGAFHSRSDSTARVGESCRPHDRLSGARVGGGRSPRRHGTREGGREGSHPSQRLELARVGGWVVVPTEVSNSRGGDCVSADGGRGRPRPHGGWSS